MSFRRGDVYLDKTREPMAGHAKFFVVVGEDEDMVIAYPFINSRINENYIKAEVQRLLQIPLAEESYKFLEHNSYINAAKFFQDERVFLERLVRDKLLIYKGRLTEADLTLLMQRLKSTPLYSRSFKQRFFYTDNE